ncbi:MAG: thiol:disulfide interchange protein DsbG [Nevskiaceae bacterium]|nr:MAG: thiol:disulfide interchange protein DsbG [Nevskiaceae bacterium]TBR72554.1 MAG: thiol:disulfide interchange protein DsbG [Nevskiaceae bacterium]
MTKIAILLFGALMLCACSKSSAPASADAAGSNTSSAADAIQKAFGSKGVQVGEKLDAPAGFEAYVANYNGHPIPIYVLPDHKHFLVGTLFDADGTDLTHSAMEKLASSHFGEAQWQKLEKATWVAEGDTKATHVIYVFVDTRCPYCHEFWKQSQPLLAKGGVQVRNILVGVIKPESLPEAANILDAKDPAAAWQANEAGFRSNPTPATNASAAATEKVRANTRLMTELGFRGTPSIIWKDVAGKIHTLQGLPRDAKDLAAVFATTGS